MKLMSDLIAYLRDLLVFKVKPDALADEAESELQKSLVGAEAAADRDRPPTRVDRSIRRSGRPDEMGAEQEAAFRSRGDQSDPNPQPGHAERGDRESCRAARWKSRTPSGGWIFATCRQFRRLAGRHEIKDRAFSESGRARRGETGRADTAQRCQVVVGRRCNSGTKLVREDPAATAAFSKPGSSRRAVLGTEGRTFLSVFRPTKNR